MEHRDLANHEEEWLLDVLEEHGADDSSFRSRDFIVVENDDNKRVATGRTRRHKLKNQEICEITSVCVMADEEEVEQAVDSLLYGLAERTEQFGLEYVYAFPRQNDLYTDRGFEEIHHNDIGESLRQRMKYKQNDLDVTVSALMAKTEDVQDAIETARESTQETGDDVSKTEVEKLAEEMRPETDSEITTKYST